MNSVAPTQRMRIRAFLVDWLIWTYLPVSVLYFFRKELARSLPIAWLYLGSIALGAVLALVVESQGTTIGERLSGLTPEEPLEERGKSGQAPWHRTQIGWTAVVLMAVTFVLGWRVTEINLYYLFTRADRMQNMTDRLLRPYWPVIGVLIEKMIETIFLALMATVLAIPLAAIVSFLAARNVMYRLTTQWGSFLAGLIGAIVGASLGAALVRLALSPLQGTVIDAKLVGGILTPLVWLAGLLGAGYLGSARMAKLMDKGSARAVRGVCSLLAAALGAGVAYMLSAIAATVVFSASWRIFAREIPTLAYAILAAGSGVGAVYGLRRDPAEEFAIGKLAYGSVRFVLNATRSIEPFVWALIFVTWFRLGPFPGMVALMVHSVAALGKLYSEQIESIELGPVEAVRATGANELQTIAYAIIPQIIPPFISFTIYRWDINVRMSTIIGLVGGGGVGQLLFQYQNLGQWRRTSVAVILIVAVVMALDSLSARVRERIL